MRREILKSFDVVSLHPVDNVGKQISTYFGENIFNLRKMERYVSKKTLLAFKNWIIKGKKIDMKYADEIAEAMKDWAISKGATHYTHWFQPLTGLTAEKHDSFIKLTMPGQVIESFTGGKLISGEPDASSFPSGGIRSTFEARGYTAWDPSSPAFIMETSTGKTLCIPSIFISYTGEALDKKLPLLKSESVINKSACRVLKLFGKDVDRVVSTCGAEQEYFLIDKKFQNYRQDVLLTGRTLIGAPSPKGQQMEDQYFGSIKDRVMNFMNVLEEEAYKYGIPLSTRHNEVAPNQYEFAPIFEESNLAADHNQLLMDIMKKTANKLGLACLLHEKPFAGVNGSGKHVNWALSDNLGNNLLNPGNSPEDNVQFLTFLVAVLRSVYKYSDLLFSSVVSAGNEHRLGANEAPPAIISVFLGDFLDKILNHIELGKDQTITKDTLMDLGLSKLPNFSRDNTDRNRTSPFAFTGAKFEFRAVGSQQNIATPVTFLNTMVAESLDYLAEKIENKLSSDNADFNSVVFSVLREVIIETRNIRFEGNNYSDEWVNEAAKRGLKNTPSAVEALKSLCEEKNIALLEKYNVLTKDELISRYHIWVENYINLLEIEANTLIEMVKANVVPDALEYLNLLLNNYKNMLELHKEDVFASDLITEFKENLEDVTNKIYYVRKNLKKLVELVKTLENMDEVKKGEVLYSEYKPLADHIRKHVDELETEIPDKFWTLPKYREMLFLI